ncbi:MAG: hypothetical protein ACRDHP_10600 [Ktedonobacterales bacterium]
MVGEVVELELEFDPLDCELKELLPEEVEDDELVDWPLDVPVAVVVVPLLVADALVVARWLPTARPKALNPNIAATTTPRFSRDTMRSASAFERLGAAVAVPVGACRCGAATGAACRAGGAATTGIPFPCACVRASSRSRGGYSVVG